MNIPDEILIAIPALACLSILLIVLAAVLSVIIADAIISLFRRDDDGE